MVFGCVKKGGMPLKIVILMRKRMICQRIQGYLGYHVFRGHMSRARAIEHRNHPVWGTHHMTKHNSTHKD